MAFQFEELETIGTIDKNARMLIPVRVVRVNGTVMADVRLFTKGIADEDECRATKKGLCVTAAQLDDLMPLLQAARDKLAGMTPSQDTDAA